MDLHHRRWWERMRVPGPRRLARSRRVTGLLLALAAASLAAAFADDQQDPLSALFQSALAPGQTDNTPLSIRNTQDLCFGSLIPSTGGTVTVKAQNGKRKTTGAVVALPLPAGQAAEFLITGPKSGSYGILFPETAVLVRAGGSDSMVLSGFDLHPPRSTGFLGGEGRQELKLGATLTVGSHQRAGEYQGELTVTVVYE
jgi:hypothetical protein